MPERGLPRAPEDIDAAWLTEVLAPRYPGVQVTAAEIVDQHELTNNHAKFRLHYGADAGAPPTMFCKLAPLDPTRRDAIIASGMGWREAKFYAGMAATVPMRTPVVHAAVGHDDGTFVILLEDLDATGCLVSDGSWAIGPDAAAAALEDLAALHVRFATGPPPDWVPVGRHNRAYAAPMLAHALEHDRHRLSEQFAALAALYIDQADRFHALWTEGPHTVLHGDPHIGNLFVDAGRVGFLDWGIINASTPMRDVSYFLNMAVGTEDRRRHQADLIRHYLSIWNGGGGEPLTFDQAWRAHRLHAAYLVTACCQVVMFPAGMTERRRKFSSAFLALAEGALADLDPLGALADAGIS